MSKHRRVKSLVRELEDSSQVPTASTSTTTQVTPSLHTRTSSSSLHSNSSLQPPMPIVSRKGSSSSSSIASTSSGTSSGHGHDHDHEHDHGHGHSFHNSLSTTHYPGDGDPRSVSPTSPLRPQQQYSHAHAHPQGHAHPSDHGSGRQGQDDSLMESFDEYDEAAEAEDEFLPMTSPFTPGYSMNGNLTPTKSPRRDSWGLNGSSPTSSNSTLTSAASTPHGMTAAERREHSRRHSRVHSRNLSVFFPRPEQKGLPGYQDESASPDRSTGSTAITVDVPGAQTKGWGFANGGAPAGLGGASDINETQANSRRGHHHRHSMSHNFFPFLDNGSPRRTSGQERLSPNSPNAPLSAGKSSQLDTPRSVPALSSSRSGRHRHTSSDAALIPSIALRSKYAHFPFPVRLVLALAFHLPVLTQVALLAAGAEVTLGASLWIAGQGGESLAVTGLGYLVVFDGFGALSSVLVEGNARGTERLWDIMQGRRAGENGVRYPFGTARVTTLSHFAQCVYLIFSAVYVCKESIEHVLLLHGPDEDMLDGEAAAHGAAHGSMGHGQTIGHESAAAAAASEWDDLGVLIPTKLLALSIALCLFTAVALQNHASMTEAVGSQTYSLRPRMASNSGKSRLSTLLHNSLLSNPFSLTVLVFSGSLAVASLLIPAQQLAPLDKVVALLISIAMFYIAYPAAVCTGKVLLQTAPPSLSDTFIGASSGPMAQLKRVLEEIENHRSVVFLPSPHVWQVTPTPPPVVQLPSLKSSAFGKKSLPVLIQPSGSGNGKDPQILVVTLNVQVKRECTDKEILDLTAWCREKCLESLLGSSRDGQNKTSSTSKQVELTVQVVRFDEGRALQAETDQHHHHAHHDHDHEHGHSHSHDDHSHHSETQAHSHSHDHGSHTSHGHHH